MCPRLPGLFQLTDLLQVDVPVIQALPAGHHQGPGALGDLGVIVSAEPLGVFHGPQILLLAGHQIGAVDLQKFLAFLDRLSHVVDVGLLDPTVELGVDPGHLPFVVNQVSHGSDGEGEIDAPDRDRLHTEVLDEGGIDSNHVLVTGIEFRFQDVRLLVVGGSSRRFAGNTAAAHGPGRTLGTGPGVVCPGAFRVRPRTFRVCPGTFPAGGRSFQRAQAHPAERTASRPLPDHMRMHATGPELSFRGVPLRRRNADPGGNSGPDPMNQAPIERIHQDQGRSRQKNQQG